ncbi:hypothetical protein RMSM_02555 [Rhodopirellula maiorica SM1]|uniref:Uncharacterized protein n=1 Tax=Rhodopirellula maiorica SM1 TaxID=1265738 RepID=M5RMH1_9BACT|nr:hypothetical protein [Rhodopirellula maiorica]EMI20523.1 hypothetical protein RMSM_02555 [Rhodopirellula maiorica SM1]
MIDEFANVKLGEEFIHDNKSYRKVDDRRAVLVDDASGDDRNGWHFYPEDEVRRGIQSAIKDQR